MTTEPLSAVFLHDLDRHPDHHLEHSLLCGSGITSPHAAFKAYSSRTNLSYSLGNALAPNRDVRLLWMSK